MGQELDAIKASIATLEQTEADAITLFGTLASGAAAIQAKLDAAIAAGQANAQDVAALVDIKTDLDAHTQALKDAVTAATPTP